MKRHEIEKELESLRRLVDSHSLSLTIIFAQVEALKDELADALRRQAIDPQSFLRRLEGRSHASVRKTLAQKKRAKGGLSDQ